MPKIGGTKIVVAASVVISGAIIAMPKYGGWRRRGADSCVQSGVRSEPCFAIGEVSLPWVPSKNLSKGINDLANVGSCSAVAAGNEDEAVVPQPARRDGLGMKRAEISQIICHNRAVLGSDQRQDLGVR